MAVPYSMLEIFAQALDVDGKGKLTFGECGCLEVFCDSACLCILCVPICLTARYGEDVCVFLHLAVPQSFG